MHCVFLELLVFSTLITSASSHIFSYYNALASVSFIGFFESYKIAQKESKTASKTRKHEGGVTHLHPHSGQLHV